MLTDVKPLSQEIACELAENAKRIVENGKGILAADESTGTIKKRFENINVENTEINRSSYRNLLFTTPNLGQYISGVILYEETLYQMNDSGDRLVDILKSQNILPGIKVDKGLAPLPGTDDEKYTQGFDGLGERCAEYYKQGCRFAKWRAVVTIDTAKGKPSAISIADVAYGLARYAAICQQNRLVPIVEPEILTDGFHTITQCADVTEKVLNAVFRQLHLQNVLLEGALLKPNMVTPGTECKNKANANDIAFYTIRTLSRTVPPALPGITFLSGGQSEEEATLNLNAMNKSGITPWKLSFSYGRALQASCLKAWSGKIENVKAAQKVFTERAKANSEAAQGKYMGGVGGATAAASLYEKKYVY